MVPTGPPPDIPMPDPVSTVVPSVLPPCVPAEYPAPTVVPAERPSDKQTLYPAATVVSPSYRPVNLHALLKNGYSGNTFRGLQGYVYR